MYGKGLFNFDYDPFPIQKPNGGSSKKHPNQKKNQHQRHDP